MDGWLLFRRVTCERARLPRVETVYGDARGLLLGGGEMALRSRIFPLPDRRPDCECGSLVYWTDLQSRTHCNVVQILDPVSSSAGPQSWE